MIWTSAAIDAAYLRHVFPFVLPGLRTANTQLQRLSILVFLPLRYFTFPPLRCDATRDALHIKTNKKEKKIIQNDSTEHVWSTHTWRYLFSSMRLLVNANDRDKIKNRSDSHWKTNRDIASVLRRTYCAMAKWPTTTCYWKSKMK